MKFRLISVMLMTALAVWLPIAAQQSAPAPSSAPANSSDPAKSDAKSSCACCSHNAAEKGEAKTEKHDHSSMNCCNEKSSKEMSCCKGQTADSKSVMECCKKNDAKMCDAKEGKSCCSSKDGKDGCGKDSTACKGKDGKECCASKESTCCKRAA